MTLSDELKRLDTLPEAEQIALITALVAGHVMGWTLKGSIWLRSDGSWSGRNYEWNPATNRNNCAEAVEAFINNHRELLAALQGHLMETEVYPPLEDCEFMEAMLLVGFLLNPKDVCRAMLEALAENEPDDE